ncbi:uncharacterized protein LOC130825582 [Amaranthus tricolor]|uniref:uncharacterized protein LOC130825582 n=1 Tax=Amaranthus tricolor TaxID=29722 RepID=UPI002582AC97|nr:uncharacterized protein LOC130825582 [Amaranthus tricolor]
MEKNYKIINSRRVIIDEDEQESLQKLEERDQNGRMMKRKQNYEKRVTIDDDERECLRRLAETTIATNKLNYRQYIPLIKTATNKLNQMEKKEKIIGFDNNLLETKKSEDINESAEKFIKNFKHQLLLQRLESIENVDEMIARGL